MKKEFQKIVLDGNSLILTISVVVDLLVSGAASTSAMNAEDLDLLKNSTGKPGRFRGCCNRLIRPKCRRRLTRLN